MDAACNLAWLHMALRYRSEKDGAAPGTMQAQLREQIAMETDRDWPPPGARMTYLEEVRRDLTRCVIEDMPPPSEHVSLLVDVICFRHGLTKRADAWRACGIKPDRGRNLLTRNASAVDWPIWFILTHETGLF